LTCLDLFSSDPISAVYIHPSQQCMLYGPFIDDDVMNIDDLLLQLLIGNMEQFELD
jgi:hypothetical protein